MSKNGKKVKTGGWYYRLELKKKTALWGVIFLSPWIIGFFGFFIKPLIDSIVYSFHTVRLVETGLNMEFIGFSNYTNAFTINTIFNPLILSMLTTTFPQVLIVIIFSLLAAILLNGKFVGRSLARTIFFIPLIMGTNIASASLAGGSSLELEMSSQSEFISYGSAFIADVLVNSGLPVEIVGYVTGAVTGIFDILAISGVPILIFLAGLQSISPALYEVAKIEGSSAYETFWKVTFPMISPMILVCTVYTTIDAFARHQTTVSGTTYGIISYIQTIAFANANYGLAAAMSTVYMLVTVMVIAVISFLISRVVFYYD